MAARKTRRSTKVVITALDYQYVVYRGDDDGDHVAGAPFYWARCSETGDLGHGRTQKGALTCCMAAVDGRLEYYRERGVLIPTPGVEQPVPQSIDRVVPRSSTTKAELDRVLNRLKTGRPMTLIADDRLLTLLVQAYRQGYSRAVTNDGALPLSDARLKRVLSSLLKNSD
jgi:hypothetical protein